MSAHTKGPWKAVHMDVVRELPCFEVADVAHMRIIHDGTERWPNHGTPEDDARLIAAAPELLEALRSLRAAFQATSIEVQADAMRAAQVVIAKATGEA